MKRAWLSVFSKGMIFFLILVLLGSCNPMSGGNIPIIGDADSEPSAPEGMSLDEEESSDDAEGDVEIGSGPTLPPEELEITEAQIEIITTIDGGYEILLHTGY